MNVGEDMHHLEADSEEMAAEKKALLQRKRVWKFGDKDPAYLSHILE